MDNVQYGPLRRAFSYNGDQMIWYDHDWIDYTLKSDHRVQGQIIPAGTQVKARRLNGKLELKTTDVTWKYPGGVLVGVEVPCMPAVLVLCA